jgi:4-amino-4-deoxy-L-arabinose transferase-like glycosyltransferase
VVAAVIRIDDLERGGLDHTELYVPGIDLPEISHPGPRHNVTQTLRSVVLEGETHPPGYYLMMHPWTAAFGNGRGTMRLPSALLGTAAVLLVMLISWRAYGATLPTCLAGAMMALSGMQVFWSQHAKMYGPAAFFGLLSTWALLEAHARGGGRSWARALYVLATLAALSVLHFAWLLLLAQMVWVALEGLRRRSGPPMLRVQLLIVAVATPLLVIAAIQSGRSSYVAGKLSTFVGYLSFGFHISPSHFDPVFYAPQNTWALASMAVFAVIGGFLVIVGSTGPRVPQDAVETEGPSRWLAYLAVLAGASVSAALILWTLGPRPSLSSSAVMAAVSSLGAALVLEHGFSRWWPMVQGCCERLVPNWALGPRGLLLLSALLPVLVFALLSPIVRLAAPRTCMMFAPYLLILAGGGLARLLCRSRMWYVLAAVLAASHVASVVHYRAADHHPRDWDQLANLWRPRIASSDVIFVRSKDTMTSGVFVVLPHREYQYVANEWSRFVDAESPRRVWLVRPAGLEPYAPFQQALSGYEETERIDATGVSAFLYSRP